MLNREQVKELTGWTDATLKRMMTMGKVDEYRDGFSPAELYRVSARAREALEQLMQFTDEGEWWVKFWCWLVLEAAGLIEVEKPVHPATGLEYGREEWAVRLTSLGLEVARELDDLIEYHGLREEVKRKR